MANYFHTDERNKVYEKEDNVIPATILDTEMLSVDDVLMVPREGVLNSRSDAVVKPYIYSSPMDTVTGYELTKAMLANGQHPVVCRFLKEEWDKLFVEYHSNPNVFFAVGSKKENIKELIAKIMVVKEKLYDEDQEIPPISIAVDIAHGDTKYAHHLYKWLSSQPFIGKIMSGSICTADGAIRAYENGCTHIRVGVGPGAACTTRLMTGCGVPQLSAVYFVSKAIAAFATTPCEVIADGGIRNPGDANKYLAAGATGVMMGKAFTRCLESAGWENANKSPENDFSGVVSFPVQRPETHLVKRYRGQASANFQKDFFGKASSCPEGASSSSYITPSSSCKEVLDYYTSGLRSSISYLGLSSIDQMNPEEVIFIKVSPSARMEGTAHGCD